MLRTKIPTEKKRRNRYCLQISVLPLTSINKSWHCPELSKKFVTLSKSSLYSKLDGCVLAAISAAMKKKNPFKDFLICKNHQQAVFWYGCLVFLICAFFSGLFFFFFATWRFLTKDQGQNECELDSSSETSSSQKSAQKLFTLVIFISNVNFGVNFSFFIDRYKDWFDV